MRRRDVVYVRDGHPEWRAKVRSKRGLHPPIFPVWKCCAELNLRVLTIRRFRGSSRNASISYFFDVSMSPLAAKVSERQLRGENVELIRR